jgi:hypothetical protein
MFISSEHLTLLDRRTMRPNDDNTALVRDAVDALRKATGLEATVGFREAGADAQLQIKKGKGDWQFNMEVKPWLTTATIGLVAHRVREQGGKWVVCTRHAPANLAAEMKNLRIAFIDTAGNAFLDEPGLFVFIMGQKPATQHGGRHIGRPFKPAGMQVIFALLCNPGLEQRPYREIAEAAQAALGTVDGTMRELKHAGFLVEIVGHGRRLVHRKELLTKWVATYPDVLRPRQLIGRYTAPGRQWWLGVDQLPNAAQWGGEVAAAGLTKYLVPEKATVYVDREPNDLVVRFKLRKDPGGEIEVLKKFWHFQRQTQEKTMVPPLLVYADLIATGNDRNIETARQIYEQDLRQYLGNG